MFEFISAFSEYLFLFILNLYNSETFPKPLSKSREEELVIKSTQGDINARNTLVEHNLRLVAHIVKKYNNFTSDVDDLVSIGTIGLIKAINTYNPDKKIKLSSYASRCIENEILMHFRNTKKSSLDVSLNETIDTDKDGNPVMFDASQLHLDSDVDFNTPGVYEVTVTYTDDLAGVSNTARMYIVVNE